jgi:hypothetical protein
VGLPAVTTALQQIVAAVAVVAAASEVAAEHAAAHPLLEEQGCFLFL